MHNDRDMIARKMMKFFLVLIYLLILSTCILFVSVFLSIKKKKEIKDKRSIRSSFYHLFSNSLQYTQDPFD